MTRSEAYPSTRSSGSADPRARRWIAALAAVLLLAVAAGCGDDATSTQPLPGGTAFSSGGFDDLPTPPRSDPAGPRSEIDGVITRSYFVTGTTPRQVLEFYRDALADADVVLEPTQEGPQGWTGRWLLEDRELHVSATNAPGAGGDGEGRTQFSLELH